MRNWRAQWDDNYELYTDALAQSLFARANAKAAIQSAATPVTADDATSAQGQNSLARYTQLRDKLTQRAMTLAVCYVSLLKTCLPRYTPKKGSSP